ncbi:MAG: type II toxin-antitoxin system VapC family toxin, partial [Mycobacteriales bacterium]
MIIDTSAIVAILFDEPERTALTQAIEADPVRQMSAATMLEAALVVEARRGD